MNLLIFIVVLLAVFVIYLILDIKRVVSIKMFPVLPEMDNLTLSPDGLMRIYEYFRDSSLIPEGIELTESYILEELSDIIQYINSRYDCADFWCQLLFRLYKDFSNKLTPKVKDLIKKTFLDFKFWIDQPGVDSMCYWSENHTLLFSTLEFLFGQEWPDEVFSNSNLSGKEHMKLAKERIMYWVDQRFKFGFFEWYSNNYFNEDMGPLAQLIDYVEDEEILTCSIEVLNLLLFEVVTHCIGSRFCVVSSRLYSDNKASNQFGNRIKAILTALLYNDFNYDAIKESKLIHIDTHMVLCFLGMLRNGKYKLPEILKEIALDSTTRIIKSSNGLNPSEYKQLGLIGQHDYQTIAQFSNEIFVNPGFAKNTFKYFKKNRLFSSFFSYPMKYADIGIVRFLQLLPLLSRLDKKFWFTGIALSRGNVYTYRTKDYIMSTAVKCYLDYCGDQHHIALITLREDLNVFTMYPTTCKFVATPGYWSGNRRMPMSVQDEAINMTIFRIAKRKRLGEFKNLKMTHTLFPKERFDEYLLEDKRVFGRRGDTYIAILSNQTLKYKQYDEKSAMSLIRHVHPSLSENMLLDNDTKKYMLKEEFDLCAEGDGYHMYVTELSDNTKETFERFTERIKSNDFLCEDATLEYHSNGKIYFVDYRGDFKIDNVLQDIEYKRFDSDYCVAERMLEKIKIEFNNKVLEIRNRSTSNF